MIYIIPILEMIDKLGTDTYSEKLMMIIRALKDTVYAKDKKIKGFPSGVGVRAYSIRGAGRNRISSLFNYEILVGSSSTLYDTTQLNRSVVEMMMKQKVPIVGGTIGNPNLSPMLAEGQIPVDTALLINAKFKILQTFTDNMYGYIDFIIVIGDILEMIHKNIMIDTDFETKYFEFDPKSDWEDEFK